MLSREEFIERTKKSVPYPLGDAALDDFYAFLEKNRTAWSVCARMLVLAKLNEDTFRGSRVLLFDTPKLQKTFKELIETIPEEFAAYTFHQNE